MATSRDKLLGGWMRSRWLMLVLLVVVVAGGTALGIFLRSSSEPPRDASNADTREVIAALARLSSSPESLVATSSKQRLGGDAATGVPPGSRITPDASTWKPDGVGGGVIVIALEAPGSALEKFLAVMVHEADGWKVAETYPIGDGS